MKRTGFRIFTLLILLTPIGTSHAALLRSGQEYPGGTQIDSPWAGISFTVPKGFAAAFDPELEGLLMRSSAGDALVAVFAASQAELTGMGEAVIEQIQSLGMQLVPQSIDQPDSSTLRASYVAYTQSGMKSLVGQVRSGTNGNAIAVLCLGAPDRQSALEQHVEGVLATVRWSQPEARAWRQKLSGKALSGGGGDSDYSPGTGGNYGSYASKDNTEMHFCGNGAYAYQSSSESYFSTGAGSIESNSSDAHQGQWWLIADIVGRAFLFLEANDGREFLWPIQETERGARVNGKDYFAGPSGRCL